MMNVLKLCFTTIIVLTCQFHIISCQEFLKQLAISFFGLENNTDNNESFKTVERSISSGNCLIDIKTGLNKTSSGSVKEPLFLKYAGNAYKFMIPEQNGELEFKSGESALIACTSDQKPNHLTFSKFH